MRFKVEEESRQRAEADAIEARAEAGSGWQFFSCFDVSEPHRAYSNFVFKRAITYICFYVWLFA
jgi:hypothetical protein